MARAGSLVLGNDLQAEVALRAREAQVMLKSFMMSNTMPRNSKFHEIIPAAQHDRNQFMILYTGANNSALVILTVDSPQIIFATEAVIALLNFFKSAFIA